MTEPSMPVSPADDSEDLSHNSTASTGSPFVSVLGFNGERRSDLLGGYHLGNGYRLYNPELRRFNSPDNMSPFGKGGINPYAYCEGDPINNIDPTGHFGFLAFFRSLFDYFKPATRDTPEGFELNEGVHEGARMAHDIAGALLHISREDDGAALNARAHNRSAATLHASGSKVTSKGGEHHALVNNNIREQYLSRLPNNPNNNVGFDAEMAADGFRNIGRVGDDDVYQTIGFGPSIHSEKALTKLIGWNLQPLTSLENKLKRQDRFIEVLSNPERFPSLHGKYHRAVRGRSVGELQVNRNEIQAEYDRLKHIQGRHHYESGHIFPHLLEEWFPL